MSQRIRDRLKDEFLDPQIRHEFAEEHLNASIALQIKVLRLRNNMSQKELAERAGMQQSRISAMEQTSYSGWSFSTLIRLAEAFDLPLLAEFGSWGSLVEEACSLRREDLLRPTIDEDPAFEMTAKPRAGVVHEFPLSDLSASLLSQHPLAEHHTPGSETTNFPIPKDAIVLENRAR